MIIKGKFKKCLSRILLLSTPICDKDKTFSSRTINGIENSN